MAVMTEQSSQSSVPGRANDAHAPAQQAVIVLIILLALLAVFACKTALSLAEFKNAAAAQMAELKQDITKQTELQRQDTAEIKTMLMNIAISAKASEVRLDSIAVYYERASSRLNGKQ